MAIFILSGVVYEYQHELAHQRIFEYYGVNSTMVFGLFSSYTVPNSPCSELCMGFHSLNEIIGYQLFVVILVIISIGFVISYLIEKNGQKTGFKKEDLG